MLLFPTDRERYAFLIEPEAQQAYAETSPDQQAQADDTAQRPKYITNYIGSKQKLVDWIWKHTPEGIGTVLDGFSGSAVVAYMYKTKGLQVTTNDRLWYCHHVARAIVENNKVTLSESDIEALLAENPKAGSFVRDTFGEIFFADGVHALIDAIRANINQLSGYKNDIALFALGKTCMSSQGGFGHFSASTRNQRQDGPEAFLQRLRRNIDRINALVFDSGQQHKAHHGDVNEILPKVQADLAYFDPPYATKFSTTNYEKTYHFVEGLMTYWDGLTINDKAKTRSYLTNHPTVTRASAPDFFKTFLGNARHISHWLISYRDQAFPNERDMRGIIAGHGGTSAMRSRDHHYSITKNHGEASHAKERLFICTIDPKTNSQAELIEEPANIRTHIPVELRVESTPLQTQAENDQSGDPRFSFTLCRVGTNRNGDHFTREELSTRAMTAINKKVDLLHSQDFNDIVGGIIASDFLDDEEGGHVACEGELFTADSDAARLAYKLMRKGIIAQVSMECDYREGECSICHKRMASKANYCLHLRKFKGKTFEGKPCFEILHGVTFTGLGLLDRKGADERARITRVASQEGELMTEPKKSQAADTPNDKPGGGNNTPSPDQSKELMQENEKLKQQVSELQKRIRELEAEKQAAANRSRAEELVAGLEKRGVNFNQEDRAAEIGRLAEMSDEAFAATEIAYQRTFLPKATAPEANAKTQANLRPADSSEVQPLETRLRNALLAYQNQ